MFCFHKKPNNIKQDLLCNPIKREIRTTAFLSEQEVNNNDLLFIITTLLLKLFLHFFSTLLTFLLLEFHWINYFLFPFLQASAVFPAF